jgi:ADP-ribosylation factor protein 1
LYKLKLGEVIESSAPTVGINVETIEYHRFLFHIWDFGGQEKMRCDWSPYFQNNEAVVFMVDSADRERISIARDVLHKILQDYFLKDSVLLVFGNKQDLPNTLNKSELIDLLNLSAITDHQWSVQCGSAVTGEGLLEGLQWISSELDAKKNSGSFFG